jgi:signal transduction histidine kinase/CheY-like chemotaxis protein
MISLKSDEPKEISKELAFDLQIAVKQVYFSCITGISGIIFITTVLLVHSTTLDVIFLRNAIAWIAFGMFNITYRLHFYLQWAKQSVGQINDIDFLGLQRRRWQGALLAGVLWGAAGFLFLDDLSFAGQLLLLFALVMLNITGIPTLYASTLAFILLWLGTWLPLLCFKHDRIPSGIVFVFSGMVLIIGLFISYALRKAIKNLYFMNERSSERAISLDKDNQQLKMFFLAANHDLSQPISAIQHAIHALTKQAENSQNITRPLGIIRASTASLSRLIEDIIHFERIKSGISKADMVPVNLDEVFKRVIARCDHLAKAKRINLRARATTRWARTDAYILERILGNLVENALRYTSKGSVVLAARSHEDQVSIEVWDTGLGMAKEDMDHIFEVFYRRDATKDMHKGYGLGLSIVRSLAESIDGFINVKSTLGKGSVFKLLLPSFDEAVFSDERPASPMSIRKTTNIEGMKIAILDDDRILLGSIVQVLQDESANVTSATSKEELAALIALDPSGYHAIITDWNLRAGTGESALNELKTIDEFNPAWIVISGEINAEKEAELIKRGVPVIRKPFSPDVLIQQLKIIYSKVSVAEIPV